MKTPDELFTCPDCKQPGFTARGLQSHRGNARCRKTESERAVAAGLAPLKPSPRPAEAEGRALAKSAVSRVLVPAGAKPLTLDTLDVMPPTPHAGRGLKDMTLGELEAADRGLRALPERLEKMSGICAVLNGLILAEIKGRLAHKEFTPWLKANYGKSDRTARRYMQIAEVFSKNGHSVRFEPQQLTLALLDDTQAGALDINHPVVMAVEKWADGRSFRALFADECGDGRADNPGGFRPNATILRGWLKKEYPDHPEYLKNADCFAELPAEVRKRFKAEGKRYEERLTNEARAELEREEEALDWWQRGPAFIAAAHDHGLDDFASTEQLQAMHDLLGDFRAQVRRKIDARAKAAPAKSKALAAK